DRPRIDWLGPPRGPIGRGTGGRRGRRTPWIRRPPLLRNIFRRSPAGPGRLPPSASPDRAVPRRRCALRIPRGASCRARRGPAARDPRPLLVAGDGGHLPGLLLGAPPPRRGGCE